MAENFPKIQESHKEILFLEWKYQEIKSERVTSRAIATMNSVIELVNNNLHMSNLIFDCSPDKLLKEKALQHHWRQELASREKHIREVQNLTWDAFYFLLVKPHS